MNISKNPLSVNRNSYDCLYDVLEACKGGARKSNIVYRANMNFTLIAKYLPFVLERGLVQKLNKQYFITDLGQRFLSTIDELRGIIVGYC